MTLAEEVIPLSGIAEADETYLLESQKGARHLTRPTRRRGGQARNRGISPELHCIVVARDRADHTVGACKSARPCAAAICAATWRRAWPKTVCW